jgi:hypothetical protein
LPGLIYIVICNEKIVLFGTIKNIVPRNDDEVILFETIKNIVPRNDDKIVPFG